MTRESSVLEERMTADRLIRARRGSFGACRWRMTGQTPDGAMFAVQGVDLYEFRGNLIRVKDVYQKA